MSPEAAAFLLQQASWLLQHAVRPWAAPMPTAGK
eukprot:CAMPEP_0172714992 /NCGR_PEP_ID=MMETSP1074-20121228/67288_1 /TAXON_ID=2916 /ORGANISM="Ceratium fusus, Strain PA161109" /LENGTH=33 /DNA_ID= /DNA_START= /DNA_END= /DNA_ORIENTATION=